MGDDVLGSPIHGTVEHAVLYEGGIDREYLVAGARDLLRRVLGDRRGA